ncbi:MAG: hypothetical protein GF401_05370 [Chitinivibrionales bacterium]|nr:hypothetical protein [Chitinivibrionales bacterium]
MTLRAIIIGFFFAGVISSFTYFNDHVIRQTYLIGNHFPVIVFGGLTLLVLFVNPLLRLIKITKVLSSREMLVIIALGLVVCGWPGSGFFRYFAPVVSQPQTMYQSKTAWKAANVISYVPGVDPQLGEGHIKNWDRFIKDLQKSDEGPLYVLKKAFPENVESVIKEAIIRGRVESTERQVVLRSINELLLEKDLISTIVAKSSSIDSLGRFAIPPPDSATKREIKWFSRHALQRALPQYISPAPKGQGVLLANGDLLHPALQRLTRGAGRKGDTSIPWKAWWPSIFLWGGLGLLLAMASLCMVVIVHPQWKRELLPYPIARFAQEFTQTDEINSQPAILRSQVFWGGFIAIFVFHLINGLYAWDLTFINITRVLQFKGLEQVFPNAKKFDYFYTLITSPIIYPTIIAFAFFLSLEVSFSIGIANYLFLGLYASMITRGIMMPGSVSLDPSNTGLMRFGSYIGIAGMTFFIGRRYYLNVISSTFGFRPNPDTPPSAIWASRAFIPLVIGMVILLNNAGLDWVLGSLMIAITLLMFFVITRINVETGAFFVQPNWGVVGILMAVFGMGAIGPTAYILMALVAAMFTMDPRETFMPFLANGLEMATGRFRKYASNKSISLIAVMVLAGFAVALVTSLKLQYVNGLDAQDYWALNGVPKYPFKFLTHHLSELSAYNELSQSVKINGFERFFHMNPDYTLLGWGLAGLALVLICSIGRLRFPWWPLHPVAFLIWGTMPGCKVALSFLIGWAVKTGVVKLSGVRGYRQVKPLMIGIIAGEVCAAFFWTLVGTLYFLRTGMIPKIYEIFPL